jgi:uncharacterized alkaline shock family protein YloU
MFLYLYLYFYIYIFLNIFINIYLYFSNPVGVQEHIKNQLQNLQDVALAAVTAAVVNVSVPA